MTDPTSGQVPRTGLEVAVPTTQSPYRLPSASTSQTVCGDVRTSPCRTATDVSRPLSSRIDLRPSAPPRDTPTGGGDLVSYGAVRGPLVRIRCGLGARGSWPRQSA